MIFQAGERLRAVLHALTVKRVETDSDGHTCGPTGPIYRVAQRPPDLRYVMTLSISEANAVGTSADELAEAFAQFVERRDQTGKIRPGGGVPLTHDDVDTVRWTDDDTGIDRYALMNKRTSEPLLEFASLDDTLGIAIDLLIECRAGAAEIETAQRLAGGA